MAGSQEYMAMEKLYELYQEDRYDLLVLDTPPTRHALDFIEAPERMTRFIEGKSLQFFLRPGRLGVRVIGRSGGALFGILKRITGIDLLQDLSDFFQSFGDMATGFRDRAQRVNDLLSHRDTTFMLVTAPEREPIDEAIFFWRKLDEAKLPFGGVVVNKVHHDYLSVAQAGNGAKPDITLEQLAGDLERSLDGNRENAALAAKVRENFERYRILAERDRSNINRLTRELASSSVIEVPYLDEDVCDIGGLAQVNRYLFSSQEEREAILESAVT
jgi:anion-transporting  ArsA/GET3 family ATPase